MKTKDSVENQRLLIIVPAFNEQESVKRVIERINAVKPALEGLGLTATVALIDDGSTDATVARAEEAKVDRVVRHRVNRGLGAAVRTGLQTARDDGYDIMVKIDADDQHEPKEIADLIAPILADRADVVYGDRFQHIAYQMPWVRRIGNRVFIALMNRLTDWDVSDSQPGILAVGRPYLKVAHLPGDYNYTQQLMLDAFHRGMRFAQVPVTFNPRTTGASFINFGYPFKVLPQILMVLVGVRPFKVFGPIAAVCLLLSGGLFVYEITEWMFFGAEKPVQSVNFVLGFGLFGVQTLFFGLLAELIVSIRR